MAGCPNVQNPFHQCNDWCKKHWGESNSNSTTKQSQHQSFQSEEDLGGGDSSLPSHFGAPSRKRNFQSSHTQQGRYSAVPPPSTQSENSSSETSSSSSSSSAEQTVRKGPTDEEIAAASDNPRKRKFLELKQKMSKAMVLNRAEVKAEASGKSSNRSLTDLSALPKEEEDKDEEEKDDGKKDSDPAKRVLQITAEDAEWHAKKKRKKNKKTRILVDFGVEQSKRAYDRRLNELPDDEDSTEYEKQKETTKDFYRDADSLEYGNWDVKRSNVEKMAKEVNKLVDKRKNYSRRREFYEDADVTYINERNRKYNEKIARFYDDYTVEIQQNLERGTAL